MIGLVWYGLFGMFGLVCLVRFGRFGMVWYVWFGRFGSVGFNRSLAKVNLGPKRYRYNGQD